MTVAMFAWLFMMQHNICIPLSLPREAFVMCSNYNLIGQYLKNNRVKAGERVHFIGGGVRG